MTGEETMIKVPRFMEEYASYRKDDIKNHILNEEYVKSSIEQIDRVLKIYKKGLITLEEAMEFIVKA